MRVRALGDRVLIKPIANPTQTESGLFLSEHRKPECQGVVVTVGPKVSTVKRTDHVVFSWALGQEFMLDDNRFRLMREQDVSAVIEDAQDVYV